MGDSNTIGHKNTVLDNYPVLNGVIVSETFQSTIWNWCTIDECVFHDELKIR